MPELKVKKGRWPLKASLSRVGKIERTRDGHSADISAECRSPYPPIVSTDTWSTDALSTDSSSTGFFYLDHFEKCQEKYEKLKKVHLDPKPPIPCFLKQRRIMQPSPELDVQNIEDDFSSVDDV